MTLDEADIAKIAALVREQLPAGETRIQTKPVKCRDAWWPNTSGFPALGASEEIFAEMQDEIGAIEECLKRLDGYKQKRAEDMSEEDLIDALSDQMNRRSTALSLWDHIAFPLRCRGDLVYRIGPRTNFDTIKTDEFVRLATIQTVQFKRELARQAKELRLWRAAFGVITAVLLFFALRRFQVI